MSFFIRLRTFFTNLFKKNKTVDIPAELPVRQTVPAPVTIPVTPQPVAQVVPGGLVFQNNNGETPMARDPKLGEKVVAYMLPVTDNWNNPISPGAHPQIGINGCSYVTNYILGNPNIPDNPDGYEQAFAAVQNVPLMSVQGNPMGTVGNPAQEAPKIPLPLTPEIQTKLNLYYAVCTEAWDKVGYLVQPGNSDIFNYLVSTSDMSWFNAAYDATRAGQYDPVHNVELTHPRVYEAIP